MLKSFLQLVDISQKRLPLVLIIILVAVLIVQFMGNSQSTTLIDTQTCELYIKDAQIGGKQYLGEFDSKCLDLRNMAP